jgi:hypothetical protein
VTDTWAPCTAPGICRREPHTSRDGIAGHPGACTAMRDLPHAAPVRGGDPCVHLTQDERDELRDAALRGQLGPKHAALVERLANELDDDNQACAAYVMRRLATMALGTGLPLKDRAKGW